MSERKQQPSIGRIVHYVSYGTPGGEYPSTCRAAVVAQVRVKRDGSLTADLAVLNPEGLFFNHGVEQDEDAKAGGTWHWPERVG